LSLAVAIANPEPVTIHAPQVTNFLWPFKLSTAAGGLVAKGKHYVEGGQAGNRQEKINAMISKMN
jgi:large subunit ribosomal protein L7e